ncbi:MAG: SPFH domain-containing protein [Buchananella hordeovulneris]|nr:SPFH domain-containing protein [Buchananella hordeovulneris]
MFENPASWVALVALGLVIIFVLTALLRAVQIVPQGVAIIVERLGKFQSEMHAGFHVLIPFIDRVRTAVDLREQVVSFPPQQVITSENLMVSIDSVIYYQVTNPRAATYEIANFISAIEQLTVTTLRNVIGTMDLEQTLTSRDQINGQLRGVLDEATSRWGIRVNRVELKAIDPPPTLQGAMEAQMRAERDRRAAILTAEGVKQSQILTAEGEKQSSILRAEGQAQAAVLRAQGDSRAILSVFDAIHRGNADPKLLAYQYLQTLTQIANGTASKMWVVPTEFTAALSSVTAALGGGAQGAPVVSGDAPQPRVEFKPEELSGSLDVTLEDPAQAVAEAQAAAQAVSEVVDEVGGTGPVNGPTGPDYAAPPTGPGYVLPPQS